MTYQEMIDHMIADTSWNDVVDRSRMINWMRTMLIRNYLMAEWGRQKVEELMDFGDYCAWLKIIHKKVIEEEERDDL